jgi:hypothetical protein
MRGIVCSSKTGWRISAVASRPLSGPAEVLAAGLARSGKPHSRPSSRPIAPDPAPVAFDWGHLGAFHNTKPNHNTMFNLVNEFTGSPISNHRTILAAVKAQTNLCKRVKRIHGSSAYTPVKILCDGQKLSEAQIDEMYEAHTDIICGRI